jgi:hypothetical protein
MLQPPRRRPSYRAYSLAALAALAALLGVGVAHAGATAGPDPVITNITLPGTSFGAILVDDAHSHVLISSPAAGSVLVRNADGSADTAITGLTSPGPMAIDSSDQFAYVGEQGTHDVAQIDLATLTVAQTFDMSGYVCSPASLAVAGSRLWVASKNSTCPPPFHELASVNLTDGTVSAPSGNYDLSAGPVIVSDPTDASAIFSANSGETPAVLERLNITDPMSATTVDKFSPGGCYGVPKGGMVVSPDGSTVTMACNALDRVDATDLSSKTELTSTDLPNYVAQAADGALFTLGAGTNTQATDSNAYVAGGTAPIETFHVFSTAFPTGVGAAMSADGSMAYAVECAELLNQFQLTTITNPLTPQPVISVTPAVTASHPGNVVNVSGSLQFTDASSADGLALDVSLVNGGGVSTPIGQITTGANGAFQTSVTMPATPGKYSVVVSYDGDSVRTSGSGSASITDALTPTTVTIAVSKAAITVGGSVTVTVHVANHTGVEAVTLEKILWNNTVTTAKANVGTGGNATFVVSPKNTTTYQAISAAGSKYASAKSAYKAVTVAARFTTKMAGGYTTQSSYRLYHYAASCPKAGHVGCPTYDVTLAPATANAPINVILQQFYAGAWHQTLKAATKVGANSKLVFTIFYSNANIKNLKFRLESVFTKRNANTAAVSPWSYFKVTT